MNRINEKITAKGVSSRIRRRTFQIASGWKNEKSLIYACILLMILSIILVFTFRSWAADIDPSRVGANPGITVTRLDSEHLEIMIVSVEKDNEIEYLIYSTSNGTGFINKSSDPLSPVRDAGDFGVIPVSGYNENVEIFALMHGERIKIYTKTE